MVLSLLPTTALAAAPSAPTNLRIEVGDLYQTMPVLTWDKVEGATTYDILVTGADGNWHQSNGTTLNHVLLGYDTQASVGYQVIANNENNEQSDPATLEDISVTVNRSTSSATAIHNTVTYSEDGYYDVVYHLYTITGLPANATCWLDYKFYDPARNDGIAYADNTKEEWEKEYTSGIQNYEINADGVLVIGMDEASATNVSDDWSGLADGAINPACDEYSLIVTSSSSISADGKTVDITQQEFALSLAEYNGPANTQSVSFAQDRIEGIEFGTPYTQTATHTTNGGSLVYYSMYAAIKKVNPTSGEVVGWQIRENQYSGQVTAYAAATDDYPAALAIYDIRFVEPSNAPKNIHLAFDTGDTNPGLQWTPSDGTWTGYEGEFFDADGKSIRTTNSSTAISGSESLFTTIQRASFGKTGAQAETLTFKKAELKLTGNGDDSATGTIDMNFTSTQTVSSTPLTAVYSGTSAETDYGTCAHFSVSGVPASKSMEVIYRYPTGTEYDGTMTTNTYHLSGSYGSYSFFDPVSSSPDGVLNLSDLDVDEGDYYYLAVYDGTVTSDNTGSVDITVYPLEFIFDARDPQELSWSASGPLSIAYGDTGAGLTANNSTTGGSPITYSSSDENVATVAADGKITTVSAGECTITATAAETGTAPTGYRATSISYTLTVAKKNITVKADNKTKTYGTANPEFTFTHTPADLVSGDDADDLAVTLSCAATTTSPAGTPVSITGTSGSANYNLTVTSGELTIDKAGAPMVDNMTKSLLYSEAHADVAANIIELPADRGTTSFAAGSVTDADSIIDGAVTNTASGIQFSTKIGSENQSATIPVTVTMQNYEDVTVNVVVTLVNKTPVTITGVTVANKTYNGAAAAYTGTPANEQGYTGTYEYIWSGGSAPKNAGNYTLTVKIPDDNADFLGEVEFQFAISQKALTVKPQNLSIYNGAALPTTFTLTYEGLVSGDTITPAGTPEFALKNGAAALTSSSANGTYTIEWTNKADVTVEQSNYNITKADGTLTISTQPSYNGGGGSASSTPAAPTTTTSGNTTTAAAEVEVKVNASGTAVASVSADSMAGLIDSAKASEKENKNAVIELKVTAPASAQASQVVIPRQSLDTIARETSADVRISTTTAALTFDSQAISAISGAAASGDIQVSVQTVASNSLSASAQAQVGNRPVYDFTVTAGSTQVSSFNGGSVGVSIPYTPAAGEDINAIVIYYIGDNGELETITNGRYDAATGTVDFSVAHFSMYAVGYNKVSFTDVSGSAWYGDAVAFLAARGVTSGTTATSFSPDATLTRGQFITLLMRAYDIDPDDSSSDNFSDAGNTYYTGYLSAAKRLGITNGVGDNQFAPEQAVTRQDMFTLLYNALKAIDQLPEGNSGKSLPDFTDSKSISSYAQDAMAYLVETGVVGGSNGQLSPTDTTTRAQMGQVLYNLLSK